MAARATRLRTDGLLTGAVVGAVLVFLLAPEQIANLYYMDMSAFDMKDWTRKWNRTVASQ